MRSAEPATSERGPSVKTAGILLGLGLGGFVDGIVLHQIMQWHHMVSGVEGLTPDNVDNLRTNMVADGLCHAFTWILVLAGVLVLVSVVSSGRSVRPVRVLVGWMATGWGVFNLVEGGVNHHLLQIHRVRPAAPNPLVYDLGFLLMGGLLVLVGMALVRVDTRRPAEEGGLEE